VEKGTNTNPIHITSQEGAKSVEVRTFSYVGIQTIEIPSVDPAINKETSVHEEDKKPKVNQKNVTCTIKKIHATNALYRNPNYNRRYLNESMYQHFSEGKQLIYLLKGINTSAIESHNHNSSWVSYKCHVPQRIELEWSDPFTI
jgi:hypothetical protein